MNVWVLAIVGDANPGISKMETLCSACERHEGSCIPGSLGKRGVEHPWKVGKEVVLFLDILPRAMLEPESREETEAK